MNKYKVSVQRIQSGTGTAYFYGGKDGGFPAFVGTADTLDYGVCATFEELEENDHVQKISDEEFNALSDIILGEHTKAGVVDKDLRSEIELLKQQLNENAILMADMIGGAI